MLSVYNRKDTCIKYSDENTTLKHHCCLANSSWAGVQLFRIDLFKARLGRCNNSALRLRH